MRCRGAGRRDAAGRERRFWQLSLDIRMSSKQSWEGPAEKSQPPPCPGALHHRCGGAKVMDPWSHPSPGPLPGDPGPLKDRSRASSSPPRCPFFWLFPRLPQLRFPQTKHAPGFQPFTLSRRRDFWDSQLPGVGGGCSHGPNDATTGWGRHPGVLHLGGGGTGSTQTGDTPVLFLLGRWVFFTGKTHRAS